METEYPLISAIMLAGDNQQKDIDNAVECFKNQSYPNKELILVDDKLQHISDPGDNEVKLATPEAKLSSGMARNYALSLINGHIIVQFEPYYWYAANRITAQFAGMLKEESHICVLSSVVQYSVVSGAARLVTNRQNIILDTMMFVRSLIVYQDIEFGVELAILKQMISAGMKAITLNSPELCCRLCLTKHGRTSEVVDTGVPSHLLDIIRENSSRWSV